MHKPQSHLGHCIQHTTQLFHEKYFGEGAWGWWGNILFAAKVKLIIKSHYNWGGEKTRPVQYIFSFLGEFLGRMTHSTSPPNLSQNQLSLALERLDLICALQMNPALVLPTLLFLFVAGTKGRTIPMAETPRHFPIVFHPPFLLTSRSFVTPASTHYLGVSSSFQS